MLNIMLRGSSILLLLLCFSTFVYAIESEKFEKVIVSGMGTTPETAKQNALRAAVEQVVGIHLLSDTIVQNSELINDKILSYSGGFITQSRIINTRRDGELYVAQVEAIVASTKVRRKLLDLNIAVRKVDGGSLFSEASTRIGEKRDGAAMLAHVTRKFPQAAYRFTIGNPVVEKVDHHSNKASVKVPVVAVWDKDFLAEYLAVVKNISRGELSDPKISPKLANNSEGVLCVSSMENTKSVHADICYRLDPALYDALGVKTPIYRENHGASAELWRNLSLSIKFMNTEGRLVHRAEVKLEHNSSDKFERQFKKGEYKDSFDISSNFHLDIYRFNYPNTL